MANDNRTWLYVGIGCGALALLGMCIGSAGLAFFFYQKGHAAAAQIEDTPVGAPSAALPAGYRRVGGAGFAFAVPDAWSDATASTPAPVLVAERAPIHLGDTFATNVNLVNEPFLGDVDAYTQANIAQIQRMGATIVAQKPATVGGQDAMDVESIAASTAPPTHMIQRYTTRVGKGWVMTCAGPKDGFDGVRAQCMTILDTLRVGD